MGLSLGGKVTLALIQMVKDLVVSVRPGHAVEEGKVVVEVLLILQLLSLPIS
jgi:hypothetical protein